MKHLYESDRIRIINAVPIKLYGKISICIGFEPLDQNLGDQMHIAFLFSNKIETQENPLLWEMIQQIGVESPTIVRIHSECILGDVFQSEDCDCHSQLIKSLVYISNNNGLLLYLRQEGRGIGLRQKLHCLALQKGYMDGRKITEHYSADEANLFYGFKQDERNYTVAVDFLKIFSIKEVLLITGNPEKIDCLRSSFISVERLSTELLTIQDNHMLSEKAYNELKEKIRRGYNYDS